jgi:hypothetical protein
VWARDARATTANHYYTNCKRVPIGLRKWAYLVRVQRTKRKRDQSGHPEIQVVTLRRDSACRWWWLTYSSLCPGIRSNLGGLTCSCLVSWRLSCASGNVSQKSDTVISDAGKGWDEPPAATGGVPVLLVFAQTTTASSIHRMI